ncbi:hypothetical protein Zmor_024749 [Zophobas morio]|uniref:Uncharacterized protein n=1 Tax=Zophobas morio TaxID=2755281 RepID=A0AA38I5E2_9CUCU|nr:hypothetical protein Zmor_024749 [Zophobas morio]
MARFNELRIGILREFPTDGFFGWKSPMTEFKCNGLDFKTHLDKTRPSISAGLCWSPGDGIRRDLSGRGEGFFYCGEERQGGMGTGNARRKGKWDLDGFPKKKKKKIVKAFLSQQISGEELD